MDSVAVSTIVHKARLPPPANEAQARELAKIKDQPEKLARAWRRARRAGRGKPTATQVREAVDHVLARPLKEPVTKASFAAMLRAARKLAGLDAAAVVNYAKLAGRTGELDEVMGAVEGWIQRTRAATLPPADRH